jgi:hypothetical protein
VLPVPLAKTRGQVHCTALHARDGNIAITIDNKTSQESTRVTLITSSIGVRSSCRRSSSFQLIYLKGKVATKPNKFASSHPVPR